MSISKKSLADYAYNDCFIETGTNEGRCVQNAIDMGFKDIISIEVDYGLYVKACERFRENKNVRLVWGDSGKVLEWVLRDIKRPATIYLDAHKKAEDRQLWMELEAIKRHYVAGTVVIIDDMHAIFGDGDNKKLQGKIWDIDSKFVMNLIDGISCNNGSKRVNDILVAEVK